MALHLFGAGADFRVLAVQLAQPAVIEPVDGVRVHVEQIPVRVVLEQGLDGVPEPCAVELHQLAHGIGVDDAVQEGHQPDVVRGDVLGKVNLIGCLGRCDETDSARDAGDVQLEFLGVVGELHQLAAEHALFGAPVGLDGEVMLDRPTPFAEPDGEERLRVVLFGAQGDAVIAVVAAFPGEAIPRLAFDRLDAFLEGHVHDHFEWFVALGQVLPALGVVEGPLNAHRVEFRGDHAFGSEEFLVFVAVQGPAGFGGREALTHDHDAVLHAGRPRHGVVDHDALLAVLVPRVPDGFGGHDVGAERLRGFLVIEAAAFMVVVIVLHAVRAGIGARADGRPGRRGDGRQVVAFGDEAAFVHEGAEMFQPALRQHGFQTFRDEAVIPNKCGALRFVSHHGLLLLRSKVQGPRRPGVSLTRLYQDACQAPFVAPESRVEAALPLFGQYAMVRGPQIGARKATTLS